MFLILLGLRKSYYLAKSINLELCFLSLSQKMSPRLQNTDFNFYKLPTIVFTAIYLVKVPCYKHIGLWPPCCSILQLNIHLALSCFKYRTVHVFMLQISYCKRFPSVYCHRFRISQNGSNEDIVFECNDGRIGKMLINVSFTKPPLIFTLLTGLVELEGSLIKIDRKYIAMHWVIFCYLS